MTPLSFAFLHHIVLQLLLDLKLLPFFHLLRILDQFEFLNCLRFYDLLFIKRLYLQVHGVLGLPLSYPSHLEELQLLAMSDSPIFIDFL